MTLSPTELHEEEKRLDYTVKVIRSNISSMSADLFDKEAKIKEFKEYMWDNKKDLDPAEMRSLITNNDLQVTLVMQKANYFKKLYQIQNNPYFGSIIFKSESEPPSDIYIGITYLNDNDNHLIYDWRSPICSLFYDYEGGLCSYLAPGGRIKGELQRKRQYNISNSKIVHVFDNTINIDDELLQSVLASESSDKMKNIVNTIQQEQNKIIRNTSNKTLIVQGIAGSGKTSVALHRIAFLLYKIENLSSDKILIFSPNKVFSEYISNVLPELGENNTKETSYNEFLSSSIKEYKQVETFADFIARYYRIEEKNPELVRYKQSDEIIIDLDSYASYLTRNVKFTKNLDLDPFFVTKEELNSMFHNRYQNLLLFNRLEVMASKLVDNYYRGQKTKLRPVMKLLKQSINTSSDYKKLYQNFYTSRYCAISLTEKEIKSFIDKPIINYEDSSLLVFLKSLLEGFPYNPNIEQVVIDEAQDYSKLQYIILSKIFKKSGFTILGDVNQTINPYYKYESLSILKDIFKDSSSYLELLKTYRSSAEIIEYTNHILNLSHVSAIRNNNGLPVIFCQEQANLIDLLLKDITTLQQKYKSIAIITKDNIDSHNLYKLLSSKLNITEIDDKSSEFKKELVVLPAYIAKGLEFDSVIVYNNPNQPFTSHEKYLYYVACTRAQHELIIYNEYQP